MSRYLFSYPLLFAGIVVLGIVTQGVVVVVSFFMMFVVDAITAGDMSGLITSAYKSAGVVILFFLLLLAYTRGIVFYSYKTTMKLKNDIFSAVLDNKIADFAQTNSAKHISVINNDIQMFSDKYVVGILEITKFITNIVLALAAMAFLSPVNALVALVLSSSPLILPVIFGKKLSATNMKHLDKLAKLNEKVKDFFHGFEVIKTFGIEKNIKGIFSNVTKDTEKARLSASRVSVTLGSLSGAFLIASQFLTYLIAGYFVITGSITIGAVIAIAGLSGSISGPMQYLSLNIANVKATKDMRDGLARILTPAQSTPKTKEADFSEGIQINNLSFAYETPVLPQEEPKKKTKPMIKMIPTNGKSIDELLKELGIDPIQATVIDGANLSQSEMNSIINAPEKLTAAAEKNMALKNISYKFKPGGKYVVVGGSGSGKSTLLKILMGYYDSYHGSISIGKNELREINSESLYQSMSVMHQSVFILDDTLKNNITLYNSYTDEKYEQAINNARLNGLIDSLPNGHLTSVGEGGSFLSGGERQRIAIARALVKGSDLIIFDEATANLDNETAYSIEKALLEAAGLTCIFATHRLNKDLLKLCDGIIVLKNGEIIESGIFDDLYAQKGYFHSLYDIN